jgi:hypothetical protein
MTTFENREEAFEKRFAVDEELAFKALARRNKLLGLWLAELLGRPAGEAEAFASAFVTDNVGISDDALFETIRKALIEANVEMSDNRIRRKMTEALAEARAALAAGR